MAVSFILPHTYTVPRSGCSHLCAAGGRTDGDGHHSSHQVGEPISRTLRDGCLLGVTHNILHVTAAEMFSVNPS